MITSQSRRRCTSPRCECARAKSAAHQITHLFRRYAAATAGNVDEAMSLFAAAKADADAYNKKLGEIMDEATQAHKMLNCNVTVDVQRLAGTVYAAAQATKEAARTS